jgi:hypothetical protein
MLGIVEVTEVDVESMCKLGIVFENCIRRRVDASIKGLIVD